MKITNIPRLEHIKHYYSQGMTAIWITGQINKELKATYDVHQVRNTIKYHNLKRGTPIINYTIFIIEFTNKLFIITFKYTVISRFVS